MAAIFLDLNVLTNTEMELGATRLGIQATLTILPRRIYVVRNDSNFFHTVGIPWVN